LFDMNKQEIVVSNHASESVVLAEFLRNYMNEQNLPDAIFDDLRLAAEEAFINIVDYAYPSEELQKVAMTLCHSAGSIDVTFTDTGRVFNPLADFAPSLSKEDCCDGGMGIHLIKSLTDQQEYNRIGERNVFTVSKRYDADHN